MDRREYTVGDCFYQIRNGANIKQGDTAGGYPITRIETTANDTFNRDRMGYAGITDLSKYESYVLEDGDLLMSHINSVQYLGRTVLYEKRENEIIIHGINLLSLKANRDIILPEYARYSFRSDPFKKQLSKITKKSVNQASFTVADLKKITLSVPTLNEQRGIVQTLDKCRLVEAKRQEQLSALDDLIKARFVEMFGDPVSNPNQWQMVELGTLTEIGSSKRIFEKEYVPEGIPFYRTKEIVELSKGNQISTELFITRERFDEIKRQYGAPKAGDLLISAVGTIGVIWIVDGKNDFYFKDGNLIRIDGSDKFDSVYMKSVLENLISEYKKQMSSGTAYAALTISGLSKMKVYNVPMNLQKEYADFVSQIGKSKSAIQKSLDKTQLLFNSLMQKYFG